MLFRRRHDPEPVADPWRSVAERLGLQAADRRAGQLAELLALPTDASLGPVGRLDPVEGLELYAFGYQLPAPPSQDRRAVTACLLIAESEISPVGWRAMPRVHRVLDSLQASAAGGEVLDLPGAGEFSELVTVVAREGTALLPLLTEAVRRVTRRSLTRPGFPATLTVGERSILLSVAGSKVALDAVEPLISDTLSLYAALRAAAEQPDGTQSR